MQNRYSSLTGIIWKKLALTIPDDLVKSMISFFCSWVAAPVKARADLTQSSRRPMSNHAFTAVATAVIACTLALLHFSASAAEPSIAPSELPRVPATEPDKALGTFRVKPGFHLELAAAEPLVVDPIAMSFDENGRLFVVEMRDYSERRDERLGRVRMLMDTDGDGRFDKSTVYAEGLPWPTAVICYGGGIFVGSTPDILFFKDTNEDGVADIREAVFTGFGTTAERINVQQLLNTFTWGLDNRIHGATAGNGGQITSPKNSSAKPLDLRNRDFSFDPRTFEIRAESGGGQHGLSFDDAGRKFVCSNSAHIQMLMYEDCYAGRNSFYAMPNPLVGIAADGPAAEVFRISPDEPWRVIRTKWRVAGLVPGPIEGGGRPSGYFTGATGVTIYRGNAWPEEYRGNAFVADCGSNLIHRKKLLPNGPGFIAKRPDDELKTEFIASTDNWFRPVQFANAPDGTLYVADMYREVIEHPWSLPPSIKQHLDLNSGNDRGRIYRIVPDGFKHPKLPRLSAAATTELVKTLDHSNGWHRETAARLIYERQDRSAIPALEQMLNGSANALGRLHALYALKSFRALTAEQVVKTISDPAGEVREHAVRLSKDFLGQEPFLARLWQKLLSLAIDPEIRVRYQLAFVLGEVKNSGKNPALSLLCAQDYSDTWMRAAVLNSLGEGVDYPFFLSTVLHLEKQNAINDSAAIQEFLSQLVGMIAVQKKPKDISSVVSYLGGLMNRNQTFLLARAAVDGLKKSSVPVSDLAAEAQATLSAIRQEAIQAAADENEAERRRIPAIQFLGSMDWPAAGGTLSALLAANQPQPVQQAAISALARFKESEAGAVLVKSWSQFTPRSRIEALTALIARPQQIPELLGGIEKNIIRSSDLSPAQGEFLRSHREPRIRERATKLLTQKPAAQREDVIKRFTPALSLRGDPSQGRKIFIERCFSCHRAGTDGHAVGPDLASVKSAGKENLLTSIIDPNREVPPNYVNYLVETKDSESLMGLIANDNASGITLRQAFGIETAVPRSKIQKIQSMSLSVMPEGLEAALSHQDMADLLEFIVTAKAGK
jgi:putative membrane-bound dehydrogenase-like protein